MHCLELVRSRYDLALNMSWLHSPSWHILRDTSVTVNTQGSRRNSHQIQAQSIFVKKIPHYLRVRYSSFCKHIVLQNQAGVRHSTTYVMSSCRAHLWPKGYDFWINCQVSSLKMLTFENSANNESSSSCMPLASVVTLKSSRLICRASGLGISPSLSCLTLCSCARLHDKFGQFSMLCAY